MESAIDAERRWFPRFPFHSRAIFVLDGIRHEGTLVDLSLSGALFSGNAPTFAVPGERCMLDVLHGAGQCCVRAQARVAYAQGEMVGLQFQLLDFPALQGLMRIAEMNLESPDMMKRELGVLLKAPAGRQRQR
jgi:hypothetical protein